MILTCPNCTTRYLVDPASIGQFGRDVRCAKCHHEWFEPAFEQEPQLQPELTPITEIPSFDIPDAEDDFARRRAFRSNLPVVVEEPKTNSGLIAGFCIMLLITVLVAGTIYHRSVMKYLPFTKGLYSTFGLYPTQGLMLTDVVFTRTLAAAAPIYKIDCKIINTTQQEQIVPRMMVSLLDKDGGIITQQNVGSNEGDVIAAGARVPCDQIKIEISKRSKDAQKMRLDIGNAYDLFIRQ